MIVVYFVLTIIALLLAVVLIRTLCFKPNCQPTPETSEIEFEKDIAVAALQKLVQFKTVSYYDKSLEDEEQFEGFEKALKELYPAVFKECELTKFPDRALLFRWKGEKNDSPAVLMAHFDVVPCEEESWQKPPFSGIIEDGVMWGRGTLDTKGTLNGILYSANTLISQGFKPRQDIYFAFSGGEEINGNGAKNIVNYFREKGIVPAFVLDEGGAVVENVFPGVKGECGLIGIAEKGMINLEFEVSSNGGHASAPAPHTPIGELSAACCKVEATPFKMHITKPVAQMFDTLGRYSTPLYRTIFANLWLFKGVLGLLGKLQGGEMNALVRTTVAFTQSSGSSAPNVIPPTAKMVANLRLNPQDSVEGAKKYIKKTIGNENIKLNVLNAEEPSRISRTDCEGYQKVASALCGTWKGAIVSPYLMVQCSDSRHWGVVSDRVYRFSAMDLTSEERRTIHGHNERIRLEAIYRTVEFYLRLIKQC